MAPFNRIRSIKTRLFLLLLVALLPILAIQGSIYYHRFTTRKAGDLQSNLEMARAVGRTFEAFVRDVLHSELAIGIAATATPPPSFEELHRPLSASAADSSAVRNFNWISPDGRVLVSNVPQAFGMDVSDRAYFREIVAGRDWVVSDLEISRLDGQPIFTISRSIRDEKKGLLGVVVAAVVPERLDSVLGIIRRDEGAISLMDSKGMLVYRFPRIQATWEERRWGEIFPSVRQALGGMDAMEIAPTTPYDNKSRIVAVTPISSIGWVAGAGRREEDVMRPILSNFFLYGGISLLAAVTSFLVAWAISRTISDPIRRMQNNVITLRDSGPDARFEVDGPPEIRELASAFNATLSALRASEEHLRAIIKSTNNAIIVLDEEQRCLEANPAAGIFTGVPREELTGRFLADFVDPAYNLPAAWSKFIRKGSFAGEIRIRHSDGAFRTVEAAGVANIRPGNHLFVGHDITERLQAEEKLRTSERLLTADLDAMTKLQKLGTLSAGEGNLESVLGEIVETAIAISGADFGMIQLLDSKRLHLRIAAQRGFSQWWIDFWNSAPMGQGACGKALELGERVIVEDIERSPIFIGTPTLKTQQKAGVQACQSTPLVSRSGRPLGMFSTHYKTVYRPDGRELRLLDLLGQQAADIIDRAQHEEALRRSRDDLEIRVQERTAELERKNQELQEFAFVASHDLNEPLRKIQTFGSLLAAKGADRLDEEQRDYISRMTRAANRMQELLAALLSYSRIETQGEGFRPTPLDELVRDVLSDMEVGIRDAEVQVRVGSLSTVKGDPNQLRQLFQNLIGNAVKYRRSDVRTVIKIYADHHSGTDRVFVEDNGIGFEEKYLDKIFQPFQRLHGNHEYSGLGIGLAICRKIVERHGGTITARSTPGKGSTFIVTLPAKQE